MAAAVFILGGIKMLELFGSVISMGFLDSLNPTAIAQLLLLLAAIKKKRNIWYFIIGMALCNLVMGLAVYYGAASVAAGLAFRLKERFPDGFFAVSAALGATLLFSGAFMLIRLILKGANKSPRDSKAASAAEEKARLDKRGARLPTGELSPLPLLLMGGVFCFMELTSAMPYFGFMVILSASEPSLPVTVFFLSAYTFIYILPLIAVYLGYRRLRDLGPIKRLESALERVSSFILPAALAILGSLILAGLLGG